MSLLLFFCLFLLRMIGQMFVELLPLFVVDYRRRVGDDAVMAAVVY